MARDPHGNKIRSNELCWCGSGAKFKRCHYKREVQTPHEIGRYEFAFFEAEKRTKLCLCDFDSQKCAGKIVESHSVSKAASLSKIADRGHVVTVEYDFGAEDIQDEPISFKKVGVNKASTVKAFCAHHDDALFKELDRFDLRDEPLFFWELYYRATCFERHRKLVAKAFSPQMRGLDRGLSADQQVSWQDLVSRHEIGHSAGYRQLSKLSAALEQIYQNDECSTALAYAYFLLPTKLPIAATGVFQPDVAPDGTKLQEVNRMRLVDGVVEDDYLESLCMAIFPRDGQTLLAFCALKSHLHSIRFMRGFFENATATVDSFVGIALAKMENVYFDPQYIASLSALGSHKLKTMHSFGVGIDLESNQMSLAMRLGLFAPYIKLIPISNID